MADFNSFITGFATENFQNSQGFALFFAFFLFIMVVILLIGIGIYVYTSLAYIAIARKTKTEPAWLAWIPFANIYLISKMAKMHWWPILLFIPYGFGFLLFFVSLIFQYFLLAILFLFFGIIPGIVLMVYWFIWHWKIFERVGKPGWWIILTLIPYAGGVLYFVFLGIAAWGKK